ncbi:MAG: rubrerythrin [Candidatus Latescibacteria bacterium]|nr:rubrerythrin [bacterium]MBD3425204.1 rubrerythrin [Candidatus Latescibacterota bacterium]
MKFDSVDQILDFAIRSEERSHRFYTDLAGRVDRENMKKVFREFAAEELGHREKLLKIKEGQRLLPDQEKVMDLKIAEYVKDVEPGEDIDYQKALTIAMKAEKEAFRMYRDLASAAADPEISEILNGLAQEEAKHKLRFEIEYDENILKED